MKTLTLANDARHASVASRSLGLSGLVTRWLALRRQRRALAQMDARLLADIGLSPLQARREAGRPFWDDAAL